jgi:large subunit ribosomal protein L22
MISKAVLRYIRISPRKFRQIIPLVKGRNAEEAIAMLSGVKKRASTYAIELLKSAIANAKRIQGTDVTELYISNMIADGGPMMKRFRAASMGRATMIRKRTSHLTLELDARKENLPTDKRAQKETSEKERKPRGLRLIRKGEAHKTKAVKTEQASRPGVAKERKGPEGSKKTKE